jgi:hypothetical protein
MSDHQFNEQTLLDAIVEHWGEHGTHADLFRRMLTDIERLRALNSELVPFMVADVRAGLELGPPPAGHTDNCDDCNWYQQSVTWQQRIDNGEFDTTGGPGS